MILWVSGAFNFGVVLTETQRGEFSYRGQASGDARVSVGSATWPRLLLPGIAWLGIHEESPVSCKK
jgi:hypothetical protein